MEDRVSRIFESVTPCAVDNLSLSQSEYGLVSALQVQKANGWGARPPRSPTWKSANSWKWSFHAGHRRTLGLFCCNRLPSSASGCVLIPVVLDSRNFTAR